MSLPFATVSLKTLPGEMEAPRRPKLIPASPRTSVADNHAPPSIPDAVHQSRWAKRAQAREREREERLSGIVRLGDGGYARSDPAFEVLVVVSPFASIPHEDSGRPRWPRMGDRSFARCGGTDGAGRVTLSELTRLPSHSSPPSSLTAHLSPGTLIPSLESVYCCRDVGADRWRQICRATFLSLTRLSGETAAQVWKVRFPLLPLLEL